MVPGWKCYLAYLINCYYLFISTDGVKQPKVITKTKSCVLWLSTFKIQLKKKPILFNTFKVTQLVWIFLCPHSFLVHNPFPSSFLKPVHIVELIVKCTVSHIIQDFWPFFSFWGHTSLCLFIVKFFFFYISYLIPKMSIDSIS